MRNVGFLRQSILGASFIEAAQSTIDFPQMVVQFDKRAVQICPGYALEFSANGHSFGDGLGLFDQGFFIPALSKQSPGQ